MDTLTVYQAAKAAFNVLGPQDHVTVEFTGEGLEYDEPAWSVDTPHTGKFDVIELDGLRHVKTLAGTRSYPSKHYKVIFWRTEGGNRWNPPDVVEHEVCTADSIFAAMCYAVHAVIEDRLSGAGEMLYWETLPSAKEEV